MRTYLYKKILFTINIFCLPFFINASLIQAPQAKKQLAIAAIEKPIQIPESAAYICPSALNLALKKDQKSQKEKVTLPIINNTPSIQLNNLIKQGADAINIALSHVPYDEQTKGEQQWQNRKIIVEHAVKAGIHPDDLICDINAMKDRPILVEAMRKHARNNNDNEVDFVRFLLQNKANHMVSFKYHHCLLEKAKTVPMAAVLIAYSVHAVFKKYEYDYGTACLIHAIKRTYLDQSSPLIPLYIKYEANVNGFYCDESPLRALLTVGYEQDAPTTAYHLMHAGARLGTVSPKDGLTVPQKLKSMIAENNIDKKQKEHLEVLRSTLSQLSKNLREQKKLNEPSYEELENTPLP